MIPVLYEYSVSSDTSSNHIVAFLGDAISCNVTEERNGIFELVMTYPANGFHFKDLDLERVICAKANHSMDNQFFRIYRITKPMDGIVTVYAQHISYDLSDIGLQPMGKRNMTCSQALAKFLDGTDFSSTTDFSWSSKLEITEPRSIRSMLMGEDGSILTKWKGEYTFDNFQVKLEHNRGEDRNVSIEYGKNLISVEDDNDSTSAYNAIMPFVKINDKVLTLNDRIVYDEDEPTIFGRSKEVILDLSDEFQDKESVDLITQDELKAKAFDYLTEINPIPIPTITVDFEPFTSYGEIFDRVDLCDIVTVKFVEYGINARAKVTKTEYDTLLERYTRLTLGDVQNNVTDTITRKLEKVEEKANKVDLFQSIMDAAIKNATDKITGNIGGYVVIRSDENELPNEICVMDKPTIASAEKVWRWNLNGLGFSSTGYNGTYGLALTNDGAIVADRITTGTLNANVIRAGTISSFDGETSSWNLDTGELSLAGTITAKGGKIGAFEIKRDTNKNYYLVYKKDSSSALGDDNTFGILPCGASSAKTIADKSVEKLALTLGSGFGVDVNGKMYAKDAYVNGKIEGTSGYFSGTINAEQGGNIGGFAIKWDDAEDKKCYYLKYGTTGLGTDGTFGILPKGANSAKKIADSKEAIPDLALTVGSGFGVTTNGTAYAKGMKVTNDFYCRDNFLINCADPTATEKPAIAMQWHTDWSNKKALCIGADSERLAFMASIISLQSQTSIYHRSPTYFQGNAYLPSGNKLQQSTGSGYYDAISATSNWLRFGDESFSTYIQGNSILLGHSKTASSTDEEDDVTNITFRGNSYFLNHSINVQKNIAFSTGTQYVPAMGFDSSNNFIVGSTSYNTKIKGKNIDITDSNATLKTDVWIEKDAIVTGDLWIKNTDTSKTSYKVLQVSGGIFNIGNSNISTQIKGNTISSDKAITVSDEDTKTDIQEIDEQREEFFSNLQPKTYKKVDGTSGRTHTGFIAQEVKQAIEDSGMTTQESAVYCEFTEDEASEVGASCGIRYEEIIALNTHMIQKLMSRVDELENKVKELEEKLNGDS